VIRTDTIEELFDVAMVLANQPVPRGNRVAC
jgi:acyl-CoA synthetase (NDP forming)